MAEMFDTNPDRTTDELLAAIKIGVLSGFKNQNLNMAVPPFAALLVKLSQEADKTARKIVRLTWALFALTIALLALTVLLAWQGFQKTYEGDDQRGYGQTEQHQPSGIGKR